ncbi:MAG: heme biosynthesis HemY N-terminal domain-containing protein [Alphaproteobacteria bacterium]
MIRALWFLFRLALVIAAAVWVANRPGRVSISWQGWQIETSVGLLLVALLLIVIVAAVLYNGWRALRRAPGELRQARRVRRTEHGYSAIGRGLVALAAGDFSHARAEARKAYTLVPESPLALLLGAQVAQAQGDKIAAQRFYTAMLERDDTSFLALRGLASEAMRSGDIDRTLNLLTEARAIEPKAVWIPAARFEVLARAGRWREAARALNEAVKVKAIDGATAKSYEAALLLERARSSDAVGDMEASLELARRAMKLDPSLAAAAAEMIRLYGLMNHRRKASKLAIVAWRRTPHPEILRAYSALVPGETSLEKLQRIQTLAAAAPNHPESRYAIAEAAVTARLWGIARDHLTVLNKEAEAAGRLPEVRVCRLMAVIEREENADMHAAQKWLERAGEAPPEAEWMCGECGTPAHAWRAVCAHCGAIGQIDWRSQRRAFTGEGLETPSLLAPVTLSLPAGSSQQ